MVKNTKYLATMGILLAVALVMTLLEGLFAGFMPMGIRIGLANVAILFALFAFGGKSAFTIVILKAIFVFLTRGVTAFGMSLCGGILAFAVTFLLFKGKKSSILLISVCGAISHNLGQIILATIITNSINTLLYAPVLIISGTIAGICTGLVLKVVLPAIDKLEI
ncbi:MAG: Gx transporter family protein [Oscillospiraceae bacterium]